VLGLKSEAQEPPNRGCSNDFSKTYSVDFNVDFANWPPAPEALELLRAQYGEVSVINPDEHGDGYVLFKVTGLVTYDRITSIQLDASSAMQSYGGLCESWGVMH
jgi:hypothetical protein